MKLQYFGHSFWKLYNANASVVIDPYDDMGYPMPLNLSADYVLVSHAHHDHNNVSLVKGNPTLIDKAGKYAWGELSIELIPVWHDEVGGTKRGINHIIKIDWEGRTFIHCGDLGHLPGLEILTRIHKPDALFVPIGEVYTLDLDKVHVFIAALQPKLVFPMHYKTHAISFGLGELENFLNKYKNVLSISSNILDLTPELFSAKRTIVMNWKPWTGEGK